MLYNGIQNLWGIFSVSGLFSKLPGLLLTLMEKLLGVRTEWGEYGSRHFEVRELIQRLQRHDCHCSLRR